MKRSKHEETMPIQTNDLVELFEIFSMEALEERLELGGCGGCGGMSKVIHDTATFVLDGYNRCPPTSPMMPDPNGGDVLLPMCCTPPTR